MLDIRYLAGLFDGEGCVHIPVQRRADLRVPNYGIRAVFCLTNREVVQKIAEQYGVSFCKMKKSASNQNWADAYQVQICGNRAAKFFADILPYSIVKIECIKVALRLQDDIARYRRSHWMKFSREQMNSVIEYREGLRLQLKALNARGGASVGMLANSGDIPCPVRKDAEGQSRAKQAGLRLAGRV